MLLLADAFQRHTNYSRFSHVPSKIFFGTFSFIRNLGQSHMLKCLNFLRNGNANVFSPLQILPVRRKRTAPITGQVSSTCQPTSTEVEVYTSPHKYHHHRDLQCDGGLPRITSNETQNFLKGNTLPQPGWQGPPSHGMLFLLEGFSTDRNTDTPACPTYGHKAGSVNVNSGKRLLSHTLFSLTQPHQPTLKSFTRCCLTGAHLEISPFLCFRRFATRCFQAWHCYCSSTEL